LDGVFNACELRTGTAFRFGSRETGNWRFHKVVDNRIPVAHAVAVSAGYPVILPSLDDVFRFVDRRGVVRRERVILTDGGVFDNLGLTCVEPGRSSDHGYNSFAPEYIICCDAGQGQARGDEHPYFWPARMTRSFETAFRKVHDGTVGRLHEHVLSGRIKGFVLPYLGQQDAKFPYVPPDIVGEAYPTDFSPMPQEMVERLSSRGEQLTRLLVSRYCGDV
jgi:NTE family protein